MRERPMRPPVGPTENMHSEYGPDVARSVPLSGASETVPIVYAADGIALPVRSLPRLGEDNNRIRPRGAKLLGGCLQQPLPRPVSDRCRSLLHAENCHSVCEDWGLGHA